MLEARTVGCVAVNDAVSVHPFASVTVTEYVPAVRLLILEFVPELLHEYVYGDTPPPAVTEADPLVPLKHVMCAPVADAVRSVGCVSVTLAVVVQPLPSVTVTLYAVADSPVAVCVVGEGLQTNCSAVRARLTVCLAFAARRIG